jgi:hypothetical protein
MTDWDAAGEPPVEELLADRVVAAGSRRRHRRSAWIVGGVLAVAVAVALPLLTARGHRPPVAAAAPAPAGESASALIGGTGSHFSDQAAIYAAVLIHGSAPSVPRAANVADHVCATVISKPGSRCADAPVPESVRRELAQILPFPVHFLPQRSVPGTGRVNPLIVFGTLTVTHRNRATLGVETLCGPMCGEGETLVLARTAAGWRVTGTTGIAWIS